MSSVKPASFAPRFFRFGSFEFDANRGELRKRGNLLKLQPQAARLLLLLISNPGQMVSREEIQQSVWGEDIAVDYDLGINRCIRQIRSVLLDNPDAPRFVKTIPRQGYVFLAPVEQIGTTETLSPATPRPNPGDPSVLGADPLATSAFPPQTVSLSNGRARLKLAEKSPVGAIKSFQRIPVQLQILAWFTIAIFLVTGIIAFVRLPPAIPKVESYSQITSDDYTKVLKTGDLPRSILTDGSRIYFCVFSGAAKSEIAQVPATGGDTSLVGTRLLSPTLLDFSAKNSEFLLSSGPEIEDPPLWTQTVPSGYVRRVSGISTLGASWSPDAERLAYTNGNGLYLASGSGEGSRLLSAFDSRQRPYWPRWSPDGQTIRFSIYDLKSRSSELWEISPERGSPHPVLPFWKAHQNSCCGSWTANARYFVFVSFQDGRGDLWAAPAEASIFQKWNKSRDPVQLTAGPLSFSAPLPSKNSRQIFAIGEAPRGELVKYDSKSDNFLPVLSNVSAAQADFSRDGKFIAFVSLRDSSLWQIKADGTQRIELTSPPLQTAQPRWSPDNTRIAFFGHGPDEPTAVYIASEGGTALRKWIFALDHEEKDPDWSPDSKKLVFSETSLRDGGSVLKIGDIETTAASVVPGSVGLRSPRWSPTGRFIAALNAALNELMLYDFTTRQWTQLASFRMGYPNWSKDGKYLYVVNLAGAPSISRIQVNNGKTEQITDMSHRRQYWTGDAWLGLGPDDAPLLSRDVSIQQIYAVNWTAE